MTLKRERQPSSSRLQHLAFSLRPFLPRLCRGRRRTTVFPRVRLNTTSLAFPLVIALAGLPARAESTFYVATNGSDAHPGTRGHPFRTFERAREAVRGTGQTEVRKVIVRGEFTNSPPASPLARRIPAPRNGL